jgi:Methyltransferase domain
LTWIGDLVFAFGPEWAFAAGNRVETRFPGRDKYIVVPYQELSNFGRNAEPIIRITPSIYGLGREDDLKFKFEVKIDGKIVSSSDWRAVPAADVHCGGMAASRSVALIVTAPFFVGGLGSFIEEFSISPTMVFVDGDHRYAGIKNDLELLARYLQPGVSVLCHDYLNTDNGKPEMGVRQAVDEWVRDGFARPMGSFGCSVLLIANRKVHRQTLRQAGGIVGEVAGENKNGPVGEGSGFDPSGVAHREFLGSRMDSFERSLCSTHLASTQGTSIVQCDMDTKPGKRRACNFIFARQVRRN